MISEGNTMIFTVEISGTSLQYVLGCLGKIKVVAVHPCHWSWAEQIVTFALLILVYFGVNTVC